MQILITSIFYDFIFNGVSDRRAYVENYVFDEVYGKVHLSFRNLYIWKTPTRWMDECFDLWHFYKDIPADVRMVAGGYDKDITMVVWSSSKKDSILVLNLRVSGNIKKETLRLLNRKFEDSLITVSSYSYECSIYSAYMVYAGRRLKDPKIILYDVNTIMFYDSDTLFKYIGDSVEVMRSFNSKVIISAVPFGFMGIYEYSTSKLYILSDKGWKIRYIEDFLPTEIHIIKELADYPSVFKIVLVDGDGRTLKLGY